MTVTRERTGLAGAYVKANRPLLTLYIASPIVLAAGLLLLAAAKEAAAIGGGLAALGALGLLGAVVAHSINWQIVNR